MGSGARVAQQEVNVNLDRIIALYVAVIVVVGTIAGALAVMLVVDVMRADGVPLLDVPAGEPVSNPDEFEVPVAPATP